MNLQLSIGMASNPRTWPIFDGRVRLDGIDLIPSRVFPSELFWRQLRFADFDVSEMSFSSLLMARAKGDERWVGVPVFTTRKFYHAAILVRRKAGIKSPADLKGKRVGVPEYQQTAALWARGVLQEEFGVEPRHMEFWMERGASHSHAGALGFTPPPGVTIHTIPQDKSLGGMMLAGELDEQARLTRDLGSHKAMILRNHGLLTCGESIPETFDYMYYLERACQTQISAMAGGAKLRMPAAAVAEKTAAQFKALPYKPKRPEWKALLRMLDKTEPSYKQ